MNILICAVIGRNEGHFETDANNENKQQFEANRCMVVLMVAELHYNRIRYLIRSYGHRADFHGDTDHQHRHRVISIANLALA